MKNYLIILLFGWLFFSCSSLRVSSDNSLKKDEFDLYILMGQSNMSGRGVLTDSLKALQNNRVWMLTKELTWVTAKHPLHFDKPGMVAVGPGLSFGIAMSKAYPNRKIGLIPCAVGGTAIDKWQPGAYDSATSTHPYDDAVARITEAMKHGKIRGMLWHQGEGDSSEALAPKYLEKLNVLIQRIRKLSGDKNLPVVVGELGQYKSNYQLINRELQKIPVMIPHTAVATSEGLTDKGDKTHFDAGSANILGARFAAQMLKIQQH